MLQGGGYSACKTFLLVMAVLGLFSLIGCDSGNGGGSPSNGNPEADAGGGGTGTGGGGTSGDPIAGEWKTIEGKTLVFTPGGSRGDGTVEGTLLPEGGSYFYFGTSDGCNIQNENGDIVAKVRGSASGTIEYLPEDTFGNFILTRMK